MVRSPWACLAQNACRSLLQRLAVRRRSRPRLRRRTFAFGPSPVAAEVCEPRQMLAAAIAAVSPNAAHVGTNGSTINILGSGFSTGVTQITFGGTQATAFQILSDSAISATAPTHAPGTIDVQVLSTAGNSAIGSQDQFDYLGSGPQITGLSSNSGSTSGGNTVTITGSGFNAGISAVLFGTTPGTGINVASDVSLTVTVPAHAAGPVDVTLVSSAGVSPTDPRADQYVYGQTGPIVTGISPATGSASGGSVVKIHGSGFSGATQVLFGGTAAASFVVNSDSSISALSPQHIAGAVDVQVVVGSETSAAGPSDHFVFTSPDLTPQVTGLSVTSGSTAGGTQVTLFGLNFTDVTAVTFGGVAARSFTVGSPTSLTAITDQEPDGPGDVTVTNLAGTSMPNPADVFAFQSPAPVVSALSAQSGSTAGGEAFTITGKNLLGATQVLFGSTPAASFTVVNDTAIVGLTPSAPVGQVAVTVVSPNGTSALCNADRYSFVLALPVITGLSAMSGSHWGGTPITISGQNLAGVTGVTFGGMAAASFTENSDGSLTAVSPEGMPSTVHVQVTTAAGASLLSSHDLFTFEDPDSPPSGNTSWDPSAWFNSVAVGPAVGSLSQNSDTVDGGSTINIYGMELSNVVQVLFGSVAAQSFTILSDHVISAVVPAEPIATVDVTLQLQSGITSAITDADQFSFVDPALPPTIWGVNVAGEFNTPDSNGVVPTPTVSAGGQIAITGSNFGDITGVTIGGKSAAFAVTGPNQILALAPKGVTGTADVQVTSGGGISAIGAHDQLVFVSMTNGSGNGSGGGSGGSGSGSGGSGGDSSGSGSGGSGDSSGSSDSGSGSGGSGSGGSGGSSGSGGSGDSSGSGSGGSGGNSSGGSGGSGGSYAWSVGSSGVDPATGEYVISAFPARPTPSIPTLVPGVGINAPPSAPSVPTNHPVTSGAYGGTSAGGDWTYSMTDSGQQSNSWSSSVVNSDGSISSHREMYSMWFSIAESDSGNQSSSSSSLYVMIRIWSFSEDDLIAANGTGGTHITSGWSTETYNSLSSNSSSGSSTNYSDLNDGGSTSSDLQDGVSSAGASDQMIASSVRQTSYRSINNGAITNGSVSGASMSTSNGGDGFLDSRTSETANDQVSGYDRSQEITFSRYGGSSQSTDARADAYGGDTYSFDDTTHNVTTTSGNGGSTTLDETTHVLDTGSDRYGVALTADAGSNPDGSSFSRETHDEFDNGSEDVNTTVTGTVDQTGTLADGTQLVAHDEFTGSNDDQSKYSDSDDGSDGSSTPAGGGSGSTSGTSSGGNDDFKTADDDTDIFVDSNTAKVTLTSVDAEDVTTKVELTDKSGDGGREKAHDDFEDAETLPGNSTPEKDHDTAHENANFLENAKDAVGINVSIDSAEGAANTIHLTDFIGLADTGTASDIESDDGTEDIVTPSGTGGSDDEHDTFQDTSDVTDTLVVQTNLSSTTHVIAADGTTIDTGLSSGLKDTIQEEEKDTVSDDHTDDVGEPEPDPNAASDPTDDVTFDDKITESDEISGSDSFSISTSGRPITNGTLGTFSQASDQYSGTIEDDSDDTGEDDSSTPTDQAGDALVGDETDSEHDTDTEEFDGEITGNVGTGSGITETLTDPTTGVKTTIHTSNMSFDKFKDEEIDNFHGKHTSGGAGQPSDTGNFTEDFTDDDYVTTQDDVINGAELDVSIVGSPSAGTTETISGTISVSGEIDFETSNRDDEHDMIGVAAPPLGTPLPDGTISDGQPDNETDQATSDDAGHETITQTDSSTVTTVDPVTGLTTVDTFTDGGSITLGTDQSEQGKDVYAGTDRSPDSSKGTGEDDTTTHASDDETIHGTETSMDTITVTGTMPDGTVVNSTAVLGSKITVDGLTEDVQDDTDTEQESDGNTSGFLDETTDNTSDNIETSDTETESLTSTVTSTDPTTGLAIAFTLTDKSGDTTTDTETGHGTDVKTSTASNIDPNAQVTPTTTDAKSDEDDLGGHEEIFEHLRMSITTRGTDADGITFNVKETDTLDDSETDDVSNDDTQAADQTGGDHIHLHSVGKVRITDSIIGTMTTVDAVTGIRTALSVNDLLTGNGSDTEDDDENMSSTGSGGGTDVLASSSLGSETVIWKNQDSTTVTNADGSPADGSGSNTDDGSDTQTDVNGVTTDEGNVSIPDSDSSSSAPSVAGVSVAGDPAAVGNTAGGDVIIVTGTGFTHDSQVAFDGVAAQSFVVVDSHTIIAVTPAHAAGTAHLTVTNTAGTSATSPADQFNFGAGNDPAPQDAGGTGDPNPGNNTPPPQTSSGSTGSGNLTLPQKKEIWALQAEIPRLLERIQQVKQTLAGNLTSASRQVHERLLEQLKSDLKAVEDKLGVIHAPQSPVASMSFGEKFAAALQIALESGDIEAGVKEKLTELLQPANLATTIATMTAMMAAYAAAHASPLAPFVVVADVGFLASAGIDTALELHQSYLDIKDATTDTELFAAADGMAHQLTGKIVDAIVSVVTKNMAKGVGAVAGKAAGKAASGNSSGAPNSGIEYRLKRPPGVSDADWQKKLAALNKAAAEGRAKVVHDPVRTGQAQKEARKQGLIESGHDADHALDLQFGGQDTIEEIISTRSRVNRSVGGQGGARLNYPDGTPILRFLEGLQ